MIENRSLKKLIRQCDKNLVGTDPLLADFSASCVKLLEESDFNPQSEELFKIDIWNSSYQHFKNLEFSQFPLTIHKGTNYHLDLYIWGKHHSGIHDHHFQGAFKVLAGDYQQTKFDFKNRKKIYEGLWEGSLLRKDFKSIPIGETTRIMLGKSFIHQVYHSCDVNLTLCLRSPDILKNLHIYLFPGFKIGKKNIEFATFKKLQLLWTLGVRMDQKPRSEKFSFIDMILFLHNQQYVSQDYDKWWDIIEEMHPENEIIPSLRKSFLKTAIFS